MTEATEHTALKWTHSGKNIRYGYSNVIAKAESAEYAALIVRSVNASLALAEALANLIPTAEQKEVLRSVDFTALQEAREALASWQAK